jgi:hypothetical protein
MNSSFISPRSEDESEPEPYSEYESSSDNSQEKNVIFLKKDLPPH